MTSDCSGFWCLATWQVIGTWGVGLAGVNIAWWQKEIALAKLAHDQYERKFAVYMKARTFLADMGKSAPPSEQDHVDMLKAFADAKFLMGQDVADYLWQMVTRKGDVEWSMADLQRYPIDGLARADAGRRYLEASEFIRNAYGRLDGIFRPHLQIREPEGLLTFILRNIRGFAARTRRLSLADFKSYWRRRRLEKTKF